MDWWCLLVQNAPLQAVLLLNTAPSACSPTSSSTGSRKGSLIDPEETRCCSLEAWMSTQHRLMHAGAESALQARSCSHPNRIPIAVHDTAACNCL